MLAGGFEARVVIRDYGKVELMFVQSFENLGWDMLCEHWILFLISCFRKAETGG